MVKEFGVEIMVVIVILLLLVAGSGSALLQSKTLNPDYLFGQGSSIFSQIYHNLVNARVYALYKTFLIFLTIFFTTIISYCAVRMFEIRKKEHAHLHHEIEEYAHHQDEREHEARQAEASHNPRWNKVLIYLASPSSSDWKLAIIEADAMLETLTADLGFKGETLGDRLKMAGQDTFHGLSTAWEVHGIRNRIAHEGLTFDLTEREAKRVIALYERIFIKYGYI